MEIEPLRLEEYLSPNGHSPFGRWFRSLDSISQKVVDKRLARLESGILGDFKYFDSIFELRIDYGPGYRIYCAKKDKSWILLLVGGSKGTQERDIEVAKQNWKNYQKRFSSQHPL
jgi:putative addiction module killer protein